MLLALALALPQGSAAQAPSGRAAVYACAAANSCDDTGICRDTEETLQIIETFVSGTETGPTFFSGPFEDGTRGGLFFEQPIYPLHGAETPQDWFTRLPSHFRHASLCAAARPGRQSLHPCPPLDRSPRSGWGPHGHRISIARRRSFHERPRQKALVSKLDILPFLAVMTGPAAAEPWSCQFTAECLAGMACDTTDWASRDYRRRS